MAEQGWDIQGFFDHSGGRAVFSVGARTDEEAHDCLRKAMRESTVDALLIRRGPQVEDTGGQIGPYLLLPITARERLAQHLYRAWARSVRQLPPWSDADERTRDNWRADADQLLRDLSAPEDEQ